MRSIKCIATSQYFIVAIVLLAAATIGCSQRDWVTMPVESPPAKTPEATFEAMRAASVQRNWPQFFGCLTLEARHDVFVTILMDAGHLAYVAKNQEEYLKGSPFRKPLSPIAKQKGLEAAALLEEYDASSSERTPENIRKSDELVLKLLDLLFTDGSEYVEPDSGIDTVRIEGDWAFAKALRFQDRYGVEGYGNVHFKKVDGKWLLDAAPWWTPWGPPPSEARRDS